MSADDLILAFSMATFIVSVVGTVVASWVAWRRMSLEERMLDVERRKLALRGGREPREMMVGPRVEDIGRMARTWRLMKVLVSTTMLISVTLPISVLWWRLAPDQLWKWAATEYAHSMILYAAMKLWKRLRPKSLRGVFA